ncbi:secretion protein [Chryseobacterium indologenes]|uniref:T9SS type A sorting domain-containing protein n=1 Tax=Chryseobacterium indologenes TaxID=253 RepID=UPI000BFD020E|nr:T9SS type A sorting domain-containing protein [Chryseobacterium indologenes]ATN04019.1 secretion protein [Chryseobacterium indologenes]AYY83316.1 T9SS C-terminal target domain-containing protein [Chryseobacterium indologenes]QIX80225.1 T9SS type A sorting domain-containing protein [Chryseobacterium indologenes]UDQ53876.1 T9SS type A sorting domain-containing protein [Chryseobacterium indologenes]
MKKLYFSAFLICTALGYFDAQQVLWQRDIKSSTQDFLSQVTTSIDGQYLITGSSIQGNKQQASGNKPNTGYDFHLVKLDQQGNEVWEKYFSGGNHDYLSATVTTQDGGFLLSGTSYSGKGGDKKDDSKGGADIWLIRLNEFGDELWQKTIGTPYDEASRAVIQTTDLGFFVAGNIQKPDSKDILLTKLDKDGQIQSEIIVSGCGLDEAQKLIPTMDGGALLGVYSMSGVSDAKHSLSAPKPSSEAFYSKKTENFGQGDYWIIKLNKEGKVQWEKNFGGKGDDHLRTLALTSTGFIIGGESRSERSGNKTVGIEKGTDVWLISLDGNGNEQWQKSYNFGNRDVLMGMSSIHSADDKETEGLLIGGYTQAEGRIQENDETFWLLYLDSNGNEKWRKHVAGESRKREDRLSDLKLNRDGSIILAGTSTEEPGKENWKIVKLGDKQVDQLIEKYDIKIYPNPVSDYAYVEIGFKDFKEADILLYDMSGKLLQSLKTKNKVTKLNSQALIQGGYLVTIKTDTGETASAKLIKK